MRTPWLLVLAAGCKGCAAPEGDVPPSALVLVLDGVRTDEFTRNDVASDLTGVTGEAYAAETFRTVVPDATLVRAALNPGVTITGPAHAAMVTGRMEQFANFPVETDRGPGLYRPEVPTIFEEARTQLGLGEDDVVVLANTDLLAPITYGLYPGYGEGAVYDEVMDDEKDIPADDDTVVMDQLDAILDDHAPRLMLVNLHDVDRSGHFGGGDAYIDDVAKIDGLVSDFWRHLQSAHPEYAANLLLIVTADHGRHRHDEDNGWHNHGDSCTGCREVPLMLLGTAKAGQELHQTVASLDLFPTIAAHLGITMPWADGIPVAAAFDSLNGTTRSGEISLSTDGAVTATQRWIDDSEARSEIVVDDPSGGGEVLSTAGVYAAEAPTVLDAPDGPVACFRELDAAEDAGILPWRARCLADSDGTWTDMGFPDDEVGPFFRTALVERDGRTWAAWGDNPHAAADAGVANDIGVAIEAWDPTSGWGDRLFAPAFFPTDVVLAPTTRGLVAAYATSLGDPEYRYTRRIRVLPIALAADGSTINDAVDMTLEELLGPDTRVEHPALAADGDHVRIAMLGRTADTVVVAFAESDDGGRRWTAPEALPDGGPPLPNLAPAFDGDDVVWGTLVDGAAMLCRAVPGAAAADCLDVGSPRLQSFSVHGGVATVIRDGGVGAWERAVLTW